MSDKKKDKKGKKEEGEGEGFHSMERHLLDEITKQVYESKVRDLTEKLQRYALKCSALKQENEDLGILQAKFTQDRQDIVEFLNIKVQEHEKQIHELEAAILTVEREKKEHEQEVDKKLEKNLEETRVEIDNWAFKCHQYKTELEKLAEFRGKKDDMEAHIKKLKELLEQKEREYKDIIHTMERKILQDKNLMKKEMLQKVNEAVANFRRVADQQMAETTKRAIRENMAITTQLKKMSTKTIDLLAENEALNKKVNKLKTNNSLLVESEKELAKKNQANQRVIKMLVEKLKESDEMLEIAYDKGMLQDEGQVATFGNPGFSFQHHDASIEVEGLKEQVKVYQHATSRMNNYLHDYKSLSEEITAVLEQVFASNIEPSTLSKSYLHNLIDRSVALDRMSSNADYRLDSEAEAQGSFSRLVQFQMTPAPIEAEVEPSAKEEAPKEIPKKPPTKTKSQPKPWALNKTKPLRKTGPPISKLIPYIPKPTDPYAETQPYSELDEEKIPISPTASLPQLAPSPPNKPPSPDSHHKDSAVQTRPLPFAQEQVDASHLLSELRPWGGVSHSLPKKGVGMYKPRLDAEQTSPKEYYFPHVSKESQDSLMFRPTPSTTVLTSSNSTF